MFMWSVGLDPLGEFYPERELHLTSCHDKEHANSSLSNLDLLSTQTAAFDQMTAIIWAIMLDTLEIQVRLK